MRVQVQEQVAVVVVGQLVDLQVVELQAVAAMLVADHKEAAMLAVEVVVDAVDSLAGVAAADREVVVAVVGVDYSLDNHHIPTEVAVVVVAAVGVVRA